MSVGFRTSGIWTEIGESEFLHAFFSTICFHLESCNWGSKYPYLLKNLYYDKLEAKDAGHALNELKEIRTKLSTLDIKDVIWDIEELAKKPPTSFISNLKAPNLSECFISVGGKNIFNLLIELLEFCIRRGISIKIQKNTELSQY